MKKKLTAALALASLLFAACAFAEDSVALPGARVDTDAVVVNTPAAAVQEAEPVEAEAVIEEPVAAAEEEPAQVIIADEPKDTLEITEEYRWFISKYKAIRGRTVRYYDDV